MRFPKKTSRWFAAALAAFLVIALGGCLLGRHIRHADRTSSVVDFLYPENANALAEVALPVLKIPLRVGIAFVPQSREGVSDSGYGGSGLVVSGMQKNKMLKRVADAFGGREYISSIQVIPGTYLRQKGGFDNLDQVKRLMNIDVVALVSYDQVQFTDQNRLSLAYWTIVGAYFFKGNKNDTQTLMEASVYDIASRQLLFHAPGVGNVQGDSTLHQMPEKLRGDSVLSLEIATDDMIANLKTQLADFRERLKSAPDTIAKVEHRPGYSGAGDFGAWAAVGFGVLAGLAAWRSRRISRESR